MNNDANNQLGPHEESPMTVVYDTKRCCICTTRFTHRNDMQTLCCSCELKYEEIHTRMSQVLDLDDFWGSHYQKYGAKLQSDEIMEKYISENPAIRSGDPCVTGTRLTVLDVVSIIFQGEREDYDYLTNEQIDAAFGYYFIHNTALTDHTYALIQSILL